MIYWSVAAFSSHPEISAVIIVCDPIWKSTVQEITTDFPDIYLVNGGSERAHSVRNALECASGLGAQYVHIHDAARPGISHATIDSLIHALKTSDAAAPSLPVVDALKRKDDENLLSVSRSDLYRVQTPQSFALHKILMAHRKSDVAVVDDLTMAQDHQFRIELIQGSDELMKVTYQEDFEMVERLLAKNNHLVPRVGTGYDVHAFEEGDEVILCGTPVPHEYKLQGHSDADVAWHAITDALYGALALGDIGDHFPPTDPRWRGEPSITFLKHAVEQVAEHGYRIGNVDLTLICERPKVKPHRQAMQETTAHALGISTDMVSVKATTTEKLGFTGREEGIAAQAVVMIVPTTSN